MIIMLKIRTYLLITSFLIFATNFNADEKISNEILLPELGDRVAGAVSRAQE